MNTPLDRAHRGFFAAVIGLLCLSLLSPITALAYGEQVPGDSAIIANADGALLRETPSDDAQIITTLADQTAISIVDGPVTADTGALWYLVSANGLNGYVDAGYIASSGATEAPVEEPVAEEPSSTEQGNNDATVSFEAPVDQVVPWKTPVYSGVVVYNQQDGSFAPEGLACRPSANEDAPATYRFQLGDTLEVVGEEFWEGNFSWYPVNCAGAGGFVKSLYVDLLDGSGGNDGEVSAPVVEEEVVTETPVEEVVSEDAGTGAGETPGSGWQMPVNTGVVVYSQQDGSFAPEGLACRPSANEDAPATYRFQLGDTIDITGESFWEGNFSWYPVNCAGVGGFVKSDFVQLLDGGGDVSFDAPVTTDTATESETEATPTDAPEGIGGEGDFSAAANGTATVSGTGGQGLNCRSGAGLDNGVIAVLSPGATVTTRGAASNGWVPVVCGGQNGYVSSTYLSGNTGTNDAPAPSTGNNGGESFGGDTLGRVTSTNGDGVRCRSGASTSTSTITVLPEGATVTITGSTANGWTPVACSGQYGYVSSQYLVVVSNGGGGTTTPDPAPPTTDGNDGGGNTAVGTAQVTGTNGDGVRCRTGAGTDTSIITVLPEGTTVGTRGASSNGWTPVTCGGMNGYVSSMYLTVTGNVTTPPPSSPDPAPGGNAGGSLAPQSHAKVTSALNLRYSPSMTGGTAAVAPAGTVVLIIGAADNGFYQVDWDGLGGYMHGDYLVATSEGLSERGGSAAPDPQPGGNDNSNGGGGTSTGNALVDFAMGYLGYPYVWATHGPASFDCSGFTYWVVKNVVGIDIGTGLWTQTAAGTPVGRDSLQPGDLVFFQNTYKGGLSHVGIYIGGGQFIHAENESTGVKISDLSSSYYASRWYGAVRIG